MIFTPRFSILFPHSNPVNDHNPVYDQWCRLRITIYLPYAQTTRPEFPLAFPPPSPSTSILFLLHESLLHLQILLFLTLLPSSTLHLIIFFFCTFNLLIHILPSFFFAFSLCFWVLLFVQYLLSIDFSIFFFKGVFLYK